jgi:hypothetical protein
MRSSRALTALVAVALVLSACALHTRTPPVEIEATAAEFELLDHAGQAVSLASLTARGPAVVVFYRGHW